MLLIVIAVALLGSGFVFTAGYLLGRCKSATRRPSQPIANSGGRRTLN